jgi:hypothetical protein
MYREMGMTYWLENAEAEMGGDRTCGGRSRRALVERAYRASAAGFITFRR